MVFSSRFLNDSLFSGTAGGGVGGNCRLACAINALNRSNSRLAMFRLLAVGVVGISSNRSISAFAWLILLSTSLFFSIADQRYHPPKPSNPSAMTPLMTSERFRLIHDILHFQRT